MRGDALAAGSGMIAEGLERSIRVAAATAVLAFFARRRGKSPRESQIDRAPRATPRCDEELRQATEHHQRRQRWADLLWSLVTLFLLTIVVYTALHGADVLAELDDLGLVRSAY
jgi:predicted nucleic acid-binding Zn ribbon protein